MTSEEMAKRLMESHGYDVLTKIPEIEVARGVNAQLRSLYWAAYG